MAGPVNALGVSLNLQSSGSSHSEDCDGVILRETDGSLTIRMSSDFMVRPLASLLVSLLALPSTLSSLSALPCTLSRFLASASAL